MKTISFIGGVKGYVDDDSIKDDEDINETVLFDSVISEVH